MAHKIDIQIPDLGDFEDVEIIEVLVSAGDRVAREDGLITLETDKATMDVPSPQDGVIEALTVGVGDTVSTGDIIGSMSADAEDTVTEATAIGSAAVADDASAVTGERATASTQKQQTPEAPGETASPQPQPAVAPPAAAVVTGGSLPAIDEAGFSKAHASPSVRKLARELGVDLPQVKGTGSKSRVLHDDVKAFVKAILGRGVPAQEGPALPQVPKVDFAKFGEIQTIGLTRIQKISGPRLQASWINLPHVTQHDLADITDLEARRQQLKESAKEHGISLTPLAFIMKAVVATLRKFPKANASLSNDGKSLVLKKYCHLGFAADTENGLMVPVIRNADQMDVYELAQQLGDLSKLARDGKLKADQLQGASFTISSLGGIGGTAFTPIVNAPEVAILGVSRSSMQPVWNGEQFAPRLMLPISLSYDHRVIDGAYAVRFTTYLGNTLANVEGLLEVVP